MINYTDFILPIIMTLLSISFLWITTDIIIKKKRIIPFIPFFIGSIVLILNALFRFYKVNYSLMGVSLKIVWLILILWIVFNLWREND